MSAGFFIGLGGMVFLALGPELKLIGALLFSFGLAQVLMNKKKLVTGMAGYVRSWKEFWLMLVVALLNIIGAYVAGVFFHYCGPASAIVYAQDLLLNKVTLPWCTVFLKAFGCGILMYLSVSAFKNENKNWTWIMCIGVALFILCGFEHVIADVFYFAAASPLFFADLWETITFLAMVLVGNILGSQFISRLINDLQILD